MPYLYRLFCLALLFLFPLGAGLLVLPSEARLPEMESTFTLPAFPDLRGDGTLTLLSLKTNEEESITYRRSDGSYDQTQIAALNRLLRCPWDDRCANMDLELIELLDDIEDHFGAARLEVVSGYRSPEYNRHLASLGRKVAPKSLHMQGLATDIRIAGVDTAVLRDYARTLQVGGVGHYPKDGFVHVDVGRVRYW
ncbi:MAG: hypothetical protein C0621_06545 [Desulfuromonas sp.]|nr:MAG: hypothetical protein C0621_06545 [Desulfuromonas sp.]